MSSPATWSDAEAGCISKGMHLASIHSETQMKAIIKFVCVCVSDESHHQLRVCVCVCARARARAMCCRTSVLHCPITSVLHCPITSVLHWQGIYDCPITSVHRIHWQGIYDCIPAWCGTFSLTCTIASTHRV